MTTWLLPILCASYGRAWSEPEPEPGPPPPPPPSEPAPPEPAPADRLRQVADVLDELGQLTAVVGLDTGSREAAQLSHAARVAADYVELGLLIAQVNQPTALTRYWSATLGGGARRAPEAGYAGELALTGGLAVSGPSCTLLDLAGRISYAVHDGLAVAQSAQVCLGAIGVESEEIPAGNHVTVLAINAHESAGINVRPAVAAAAVTDSGRFTLAEVGVSLEGFRYFWSSRRWSVAAPMVAMSPSVLTHEIAGDRETLTRLTASAWFTELRYHRDPDRLTDFVLRLFPIALDQIGSGDVISTLSLTPLELRGLGAYFLYVDAAGGLDLTAENETDTPEMIAARPDVGVGSWRLAVNVGVPRVSASAVYRQHLAPTLAGAVVIDRRTSAELHVDLPRVFLTGEAYRSNLRYFEGPGDSVDARFSTWGVQGEAWVRAGNHLLVGATVELGRSFVFAEPSSALGTPPYGYLALLQLGWRDSRSRALD